MKKIVVLIVAMLSLQATVWAQFKVTAEMRPRFETAYGYKALPDFGQDPAVFTSQRTALTFDWKQDKYSMRLTAQDVRTWGDATIVNKTGTWGDAASLDLREAWFEWNFSSNFSARIGRQILNYDDGRLLSWRNWNQKGLSYDAALLKYHTGDAKLDAGFSWNSAAEDVIGNNFPTNKLKSLAFTRFENRINSQLDYSLLAMLTGFQKAPDDETLNMMTTLGGYLTYKNSGFTLAPSAFYQTGKSRTGLDISAYLLSLNASYKLKKTLLKAGYDYLSGTPSDADKTKETNTFDKVYGAVYKFYGTMNMFTYINGSTKGGGLGDLYAGFVLPVGGFKLDATYHNFSLAQEVLNPDGEAYDKALGGELDLKLIKGFKNSPVKKVMAGMNFLMPSETLKQFKGKTTDYDQTPYWGWVMVVFKPKLFESK